MIGQFFAGFCQIVCVGGLPQIAVMNDVFYRIYEHLFTSFISLDRAGSDDNCTPVKTYCLTNRIFRRLMSASRNNYGNPVMTYIASLWTGKNLLIVTE